jgi:hypothetical protein
MSTSTLDPDHLPLDPDRKMPPGQDAGSIGYSDSSDSGSDLAGDGDTDSDASDRAGTGEGLSADPSQEVRPDADIGFDRVVGAAEAGLGGGLDQAEEAQLGVTDEELGETDDLD